MLYEVAGANRRWRGQFRCRGSRRESAVAQFFSLGGKSATRIYESHTQKQLQGSSRYEFICRCVFRRSSDHLREDIEAKLSGFILFVDHALCRIERHIFQEE